MEWWGWVTVTVAGVVMIANGIKAVNDIFAPWKNLQTEVADVKERETDHERDADAHFKSIDDELRQLEETNQMILKGLFHLVNHEIDGNGIDGLKRVREELLNNIAER